MRPEAKAAALGVAIGSKAASGMLEYLNDDEVERLARHGLCDPGNDGGYEGDGDAGLQIYTFPPGTLHDVVDPHVGTVGG